jgi:hypothetical protein
MNKIAIPTIVLATILVAGFVAFAPVEKASAVHTTILQNTIELRAVTDTDVTGGTGDGLQLGIDAGAGDVICVVGLQLEAGSGGDAAEATDDIEVDGLQVDDRDTIGITASDADLNVGDLDLWGEIQENAGATMADAVCGNKIEFITETSTTAVDAAESLSVTWYILIAADSDDPSVPNIA